jgi:SpoVK/Ycf46/Vps4 family AAA+-type ATPase
MKTEKIISFLNNGENDEFYMKKLKLSKLSLNTLKLFIQENINNYTDTISLNSLLLLIEEYLIEYKDNSDDIDIDIDIELPLEEKEKIAKDFNIPINEVSDDLVKDILSSEKYNQLQETQNYNYLDNYNIIKELIENGILIIDKTNDTLLSMLNSNLSINRDIYYFIENKKFKTNYIIDNKKVGFNSYDEYIESYFDLIELYYIKDNFIENKILKKSSLFLFIEKSIKELETFIKKQIKLTNKDIDLKFENLAIEFKLEEYQKIFMLTLLKGELDLTSNVIYNEKNLSLSIVKNNFNLNKTQLNELFTMFNTNTDYYFAEEQRTDPYNFSPYVLLFLSNDLFNKVNFNEIEKESRTKINNTHKINEIIKDSQDIFEIVDVSKINDDVVLNKDTSHLVEVLKSYSNEDNIKLLEEWGVKEKEAHPETKIMFYGTSGTGKTMTAYHIGKLLDKNILSLDCSKILDQYVGESEKKVRLIFDTYKKIVKETGEHPILLLNEADQFLSKRTNASSSIDKMNNQMQNIFLEQIEEHKGFIIATTNLLENLDSAFKRRFNYKIKFTLPNPEERKKIWEKHLPKAKFDNNFDLNEINDFELTGGQIKNICFNTAYSKIISKDKTFFTQDFINEIKKETISDEKIMGFKS